MTSSRTTTVHSAPLAVRVEEAARLLGVSRATAFALIRDGRLSSFTVGRTRLVSLSAVHDFIAAATTLKEK